MSDIHYKTEIPVSAELVAKMVGDRFPEFRPATAVLFAHGWDFNMFEVNGNTLFRLPKRKSSVERLQRELIVLGTIGRALPLPVPQYRWVAQGSEEYPENFAGYPKLPGRIASHVYPSEIDQDKIAKQVGDFLSVLHTVPLVLAAKAKLPRRPGEDQDPTLEDKHRALDMAGAVRDQLKPDQHSRLLDFINNHKKIKAPDVPAVLCHGDLSNVHVLVAKDGKSITGIIDWGDMHIGNPIIDFSGWLGWLGEGFCKKMFRHYEGPLDVSALPYMKAKATWVGLYELYHAMETKNENDRAHGMQSLRQGLE